MNAVTETLADLRDTVSDYLPDGGVRRPLGIALGVYLAITILLGIYWSLAPGEFDVRERAAAYAAEDGGTVVTGSVTTAALMGVIPTGKPSPVSVKNPSNQPGRKSWSSGRGLRRLNPSSAPLNSANAT